MERITNWFHLKIHELKKGGTVKAIVFSIVFVIFALYAISLLYAFFWCLTAAVKTHNEVMLSPFAMPEKWDWHNFMIAFTELKVRKTNMIGMIGNSLWYTIGGTLISVGCSTTISYAVAKYKFPGRGILYTISIIVMILPIAGNLPAMYRMVRLFRLDNSPLFLLTMTGGFGFNFLGLYGFFRNLSWSYAEAAFVDGASDFYAFVRVMLPQALPAMTSLIVLAAIGLWNDYQTPLLYLTKMPTLAVGLQQFSAEAVYSAQMNIYYAGLLLSMIPVLALFLIFQNTLMNKTAVGGLKG